MTDYTQALAAAREAHTYVKHLGMTRAEAALGDLLAALDAARGQAVAWQVTVVDNTGTHDYAKWAGLQAPPAALAVPAGYVLVHVDRMLAACLPGGSSCDPQRVADAIREYVAAQAPPAADYSGDAGPVTDDDFVDLPATVPAVRIVPRDGKWVFSDNDDVFSSFDHETELSAIDDALICYPDAETIYVGQVKILDVRRLILDVCRLIHVDRIIEDIGERAYDEVGGAADSWPELSEIQQAELEGIIADYILSKSPADFYSVENMRVYTQRQAEAMLAAAPAQQPAAAKNPKEK